MGNTDTFHPNCSFSIPTSRIKFLLLVELIIAGFSPNGNDGSICIGSTSYIGMTRKKMAANRKGIGLTTLERACNSKTITHHQVVMHKSVWLTFVRRENETVQNCPIVLKNSSLSSSSFLIRCNSQTTQATELTQTRTQIAPPIKEGTRHVQFEFPRTATVSYSTHHRNSANDSK